MPPLPKGRGLHPEEMMKRFSIFSFGLFLYYLYFLVAGISVANQMPVEDKQVDVITIEKRYPAALEEQQKTVDVGKVARNLHNEEMYLEAFRVLVHVDNACLSSGTVNLLKIALNDDSVEVRARAIVLLNLSRNPEAIPLLADRLQNDLSWRVRYTAAKGLGRLAGEAAVPMLKVAWTEDKMIGGGVIAGLGRAGGTAVPFLIEVLKEEIEKNGGNGSARRLIQSLEWTGDRRVIAPLVDIISRPTCPSDPNMSHVQLSAAAVLARFATNRYVNILEDRTQFAAIHPVTPRESRKVKVSDRAQIIEVLKNAGYDIKRLAGHFVLIL